VFSTEVQEYEACDSIRDKFTDLPLSAQNWGPIVFTEYGRGVDKIKECGKEREHHPLYHDLEVS
jgi:hypothetical protein